MFKKLLLALTTIVLTMSFAFAQADVNKSDQAALDGIKGIGPKLSKTIIDERKKGGNFKDWADFESRVKGVGEKSSLAFSKAGLTVNGQPKPGAAVVDAKNAVGKATKPVAAHPPKASASASEKSSASASASAKAPAPASTKPSASAKASAQASAPK